LKGGGDSFLAQLCLEEIKDNVRNGKKLKGWEKGREQYFGTRGWSWKAGEAWRKKDLDSKSLEKMQKKKR